MFIVCIDVGRALGLVFDHVIGLDRGVVFGDALVCSCSSCACARDECRGVVLVLCLCISILVSIGIAL